MKRTAILLACAAVGAAASAPARAEDLTVNDIRCVVAFGALVSNPQYRDAAATGIFYFLGRVEGREPSLDIADAIKQTRRGMGQGDIVNEGQRCGAQLKARNESLKSLSPTPPDRRGIG
ncbi:MAG: hypothetical protein ACXU8X_22290 [Caulobacteraceae bacterium]